MEHEHEIECPKCKEDIEITVDLDAREILNSIPIECECGNFLEYSFYDNVISVESCKSCIQSGYDDGYEVGYDEGVEEGNNQSTHKNTSTLDKDEIDRIKDLGYEEGYADAAKEFQNA